MEKNIREAVSKVLNEQRFFKFIAKYGDDFFRKMFSSKRVSKATISKLEDVFNETSNLGKLKDGTEVIRLQPQRVGNVTTNPFVKLEDIQSDLEKLDKKLITKNEILKKYGSMKLQDGTSLSDIFLPKFQEKLKTNLNLRLKPTVDRIDLSTEFGKGWSSQFPTTAAAKYLAKWVSFGNLFKKLGPDDQKRAVAWWVAGVGDGPSIWKIFKDNYSIPDKFFLGLTNTAGQLAKKWLVLSTALTILNATLDAYPDFDTPPNENELMAFIKRFWRNASLVNPLMVSPGYFLVMKLIVPYYAGGLGKKKFSQELKNEGLNLKSTWESTTDKIQSMGESFYNRKKTVTPEVPVKKKTTTQSTNTTLPTNEPERTW